MTPNRKLRHGQAALETLFALLVMLAFAVAVFWLLAGVYGWTH